MYIMLNKLSVFIIAFFIMSFQNAFSDQYEIDYYGQVYLVSSSASFDNFSIKDPITKNNVDVRADIKADLFHASRSINRAISYDPTKAKRQLNNELNKAVAKYKKNGIASEWVNTQLENAASFTTSGAISFAKVKTAVFLCKRNGGAGCATVGTVLVASAVGDMGDSLGGSVISNKHLFDEQRSFSLVKDAVKTSYDEIDEFVTVRQKLINNTSPMNYEALVVSDHQIGSIQKNTQELIPVLKSVSTFGSSLTPLQRIGRGITTSVTNGLTGFPASSTVAALSVMLSNNVPLDLDNVKTAVNLTKSEFVDAYVKNTTNIAKVNKLASEVSASLVVQAAQLVLKQQREQQQLAETTAAIIENQKVNDEKSYQQVLDNTRSTMWRDLSSMRSVLNRLSDDIVDASTVDELATAVDAARTERNNARSLKRMHERNFDGYSHVINALEAGAIEACYSYVGCHKQSELSDLRVRKSESSALLNDYVAYFERDGGLEQVYDSARDQLAAAQKKQLHQNNAEQYQQEAQAAQVAAALAAQQATNAQQQINNTPTSEIPNVAALPERIVFEPEGETNEELLAKLVTGSPVSISQLVDVPMASFDLSFDYFFETGSGTLDVFLDDMLLGTLLGDPSQTEFITANMLVDGQLLGLTDVDLTFFFNDNDSGSVLWLDNIIFPNLEDGFFNQGLTNWLPEGDGYVEVVNYKGTLNGNAPSPVPAPSSFILLVIGFVSLFFFKTMKTSDDLCRIIAS